MNWLMTWLMFFTVLALLLWGLSRGDRMYQFPFLAGVMTLTFLMPQVLGIANDRFLPEGAYVKTIAFAIACLIACWLGWTLKAKPFRFFCCSFDERKLIIASYILSFVGAYFYYKLSRLEGDVSVGVQMSGAPVMWLFFARFLTYGLAIASLCLAHRFSWATVIVIGIDVLFYLDRIVVTGKRAEAVELAAIFALSFWFYRGWIVPRTLVVIGMIGGMVAMTSMTDYRNITRANSAPIWEEVANIDIMKNFDDLLKEGGPEMRNAVLRIHYSELADNYDYGLYHWNRLVWNFVPAQLVGEGTKRALMLDLPPISRFYNPLTGSTETGMADAFQSFWYFGAIKFLLLSYVVRRMWLSAMTGEMSAQLVYMLTIVPAMHAISHNTDWAVMVWVHMLIFLLPALLLCRAHPNVHPRILPVSANLRLVAAN